MTGYDRNAPYAHIAARNALEATIRENSARTARCSITWTTKGIGEVIVPTARPFNLRFTEEPSITSGMALAPGDVLISGHYPRVHAGVREWQLDNVGLYVGAWLFFTVDTTGPGSIVGIEPNYTIHHHLVFEGKAIKDGPVHLLDSTTDS